MSHEHCLTYYNVALRRCEHCGMLWCPRCREWFRPSGGTGKEKP